VLSIRLTDRTTANAATGLSLLDQADDRFTYRTGLTWAIERVKTRSDQQQLPPTANWNSRPVAILSARMSERLQCGGNEPMQSSSRRVGTEERARWVALAIAFGVRLRWRSVRAPERFEDVGPGERAQAAQGANMFCSVRSVAINVGGRSAPSRLTNRDRSSVRT
jgi:hypothetical protein